MIHRYKVSLRDISPAIWRQIQVREDYTFWDLHVAIQDSMGWLDYHLHAFRFPETDGKRAVEIGIPDEESNHPIFPGWEVGIADYFIRPGVVALYEYDFGDGWEHEIVLEGVLSSEPKQKYPRCLAGGRACPPEDCGGVPGYQHLLEVLRQPQHPEYAESVDWLKGHAKNYHPFDPERFDAHAVRFSNPKRRWAKAFVERGNRWPINYVKPRNTLMPKHSPDRRMVVGFAWFDREQWQQLVEVVEDRSELDDTFEQWETSALDAVRIIERKGQRVEKVYVDVNALVSWCNAKGLPVNGKSRAQYVSSVLRERDGQAEA